MGSIMTEEKMREVLLRLQKLEDEVSRLNEENDLGGVYVDGAPSFVKEVWKKANRDGGN